MECRQCRHEEDSQQAGQGTGQRIRRKLNILTENLIADLSGEVLNQMEPSCLGWNQRCGDGRRRCGFYVGSRAVVRKSDVLSILAEEKYDVLFILAGELWQTDAHITSMVAGTRKKTPIHHKHRF